MRARSISLCVMLATVSACSLLVSTSDLDSADHNPTASADASLPDGNSNGNETGATIAAPDAGDGAGGGGGGGGDPHLIGAWSFDEGTGDTAFDSTGHNHAFKLVGGATFSTTGHSGGCVTFHGGVNELADVADLANAAFPPTGTLSLWFRYNQTTTTSAVGVFDAYDNTRAHIFLRHANNAPVDQFQYAVQASADYAYDESFTLKPDTWTHVIMTWDSTKHHASLYFNNDQNDDDTYDPTVNGFIPNQQSFTVGELLHGDIDEVRLYDIAKNQADALAIP